MVDVRRPTDGRRLDGYTISSPCEPNGSGELKIMYTPINPNFTIWKRGVRGYESHG